MKYNAVLRGILLVVVVIMLGSEIQEHTITGTNENLPYLSGHA